MPKWIGNRFGSIVPIAPDAEAPSAIYNLFDQYYSTRDGGWVIPSNGMTATGGIVSEYEDPASPGTYYRAHVFNDTGTMNFTAAAAGNISSQYDVLVVGGGGAGGSSGGGGGGGEIHYRVNQPVGSFPTPFTCTIGAGGGNSDGPNPISRSTLTSGNAPGGSPTHFGPGSPNPINATGGGGGGHHSSSGGPGGSGGGAGRDSPSSSNGGPGVADSGHPGGLNQTSPPNGWGNDGGNGPGSAAGSESGGGGGSATAVGSQGKTAGPGAGGDGAPYNVANGEVCKYAAGGGGGRMEDPAGVGGQGGYSPFGVSPLTFGGGFGGGHGSKNPPSASPPTEYINGAENTGSGGGGGAGAGGGGTQNYGGAGGSGQIVVRYQISSDEFLASTAKATGGLIYKSGSNIIHVFETSGKFVAGASDIPGVSWLAVGGGAAGSADNGPYGDGNSSGNGGGGAGALHHDSSVTIPASTSYTIQIGAGGRSSGINSPIPSFNGTPTVLGSLKTAAGGGSGGYYSGVAGVGGGSGGGGAATGASGGSGSGDPGGTNNSDSPTNGWGNDGASGSPNGGGGGGGAGSSGSNETGGNGLTYNITGSDVVYAAGGGASGPAAAAGGSSGVGGPGTNTAGGKGGAGRRNTGSGGGAGRGYGGSGGSGIVVISYPVS